MKVEKLVEIIGADFYTGIPDSQLKALCDYLIRIIILLLQMKAIVLHLLRGIILQPVKLL